MATQPHLVMVSTHGYVAANPVLGKPDTGGQVVYVLEMSKCFANLGFRVDILTRQFEDQPEVENLDEQVRIVRIPAGGNEFLRKEHLFPFLPEWAHNARQWLLRHRVHPTLISSHYWDAGVAAALLAESLGTPHVHTPHSLGAWKRDTMDGDAEELEKRYNFQQRIEEERKLYSNVDLLVATTESQRELLVEPPYRAPNDRIVVLPPGVEETRFTPVSTDRRQELRKRLGFQGPTVLALGRIAENKGYDLLIRAMPAVFDRVDQSRLVLALGSPQGSSAEEEKLQRWQSLAAELGIAERVEFRRYIEDEDLADHYRAADLFALSSRYEPFGMTAIEAMACGTPTVVTSRGGLARQVLWGLESMCADPFDPESFGHAMAMVLQHDPLRRQLRVHGRKRAETEFGWSQIARQFLQRVEWATAADHEVVAPLVSPPSELATT